MKSIWRFVKSLCWFAVFFLVVLLQVEIFFRIWLGFSKGDSGIRRLNDWAFMGEDDDPRFVPGKSGLHKSYNGPGDLVVQLNSFGYPGPEPLKLPAGRIVLVGDSIVLDAGNTWEKSISGRLNQKFADAGLKNWEVLNLGFNDSDVYHYLRKIEQEALQLHPNLIVLGLYLNDSVGTPEHPAETHLSLIPRSRDEERFQLQTVRYAMQALTTFQVVSGFRKLEEQRLNWIPRFEKKQYQDSPVEFAALTQEAKDDWGAAWTDQHWVIVRKYLAAISERCKKANVPLAIVIFPVSAQMLVRFQDSNTELPQERSEKMLRELGIPSFNLLPALKGGAQANFHDQCHFTEQGTKVVADAVFPFLKKTAALE